MGKKSNKPTQPNAPELQQMLLESSNNNITHPPHNPYYPDLAAAIHRSQLPPPPYSDLTAPMTYNGDSVPLNYIQGEHRGDASRQQPNGATTVVMNHPGLYELRTAKKHRKVRSFNNEAFLVGFLGAVLALCAYKQYEQRHCFMDFTVHKLSEDLTITIGKVRDFHIVILYISAVVMLISFIKCMSGECRSYSCYKLAMACVACIGAAFTGYTAYLAFYSPCGTSVPDILTNTVKTITSKFVDHMPSPDKGVFGETSVFQQFKEGRDVPGIVIFLLDAFNFIMYISLFLNTTLIG